ncbi:hypothetical protein BGZ83_005011 [Gryganskiella cystojenkinii]|nr:hypothetical protein BGZ83_005011 [Gryganskiella cystojenkinii]
MNDSAVSSGGNEDKKSNMDCKEGKDHEDYKGYTDYKASRETRAIVSSSVVPTQTLSPHKIFITPTNAGIEKEEVMSSMFLSWHHLAHYHSKEKEKKKDHEQRRSQALLAFTECIQLSVQVLQTWRQESAILITATVDVESMDLEEPNRIKVLSQIDLGPVSGQTSTPPNLPSSAPAPTATTVPWSVEENSALWTALADNSNMTWTLVAQIIPGRAPNQAETRFLTIYGHQHESS